ncbi:MAG: hypothetical protein IPO41_10710 [Acidobacteria bacterium]|nr:hypothetical protein [Acidobacteriota bacterium]
MRQSRDALEKNLNEFRENIFASGTLGALNFVVRGMKELPGRKSVVLVSDGLPLLTRDGSGRPELSRIYHSLKHLIDFANRSSVVLLHDPCPGLVVPDVQCRRGPERRRPIRWRDYR